MTARAKMRKVDVVAQIRKMGLTVGYRRTGSFSGEYRVNLSKADGGTEATAYYTDDGEDAIHTASYMLRERDGIKAVTQGATNG